LGVHTDLAIQARICAELAGALDLGSSDVDVSVELGVVTLRGLVDDYGERMQVEHLATSIEGVEVVHNMLSVRPDWAEERQPLETEFATAEHAKRAASPRWRLADAL
jgi:hypothetical protein